MLKHQDHFLYGVAPCDYITGPDGKCIQTGPMGYVGCRTGKNHIPDSMVYTFRMIKINDKIFYDTVNYLSEYIGDTGRLKYPNMGSFAAIKDELDGISHLQSVEYLLPRIFVFCKKDDDVYNKLFSLDLLDRNEYELPNIRLSLTKCARH